MAEFLLHWVACVVIAHRRRRSFETLNALSDHHLADIGIERGDIDTYLGVGYPWPVMTSKPQYDRQPSLQGCG